MGGDETSTGALAPGDEGGAGERERLRALVDRLTRERDALQSVIEHAPEASLVHLDRDFNFLFVNSTYADSCHMTAESMIGKNHFELFPGPDNEAIFRRVRDTGVPVEFKARPFVFEYEPERGVTYWDWTLTPLLDADGSVGSLVFSSSCAIYGSPASLPIGEDADPHPENPYGESKLLVERMLFGRRSEKATPIGADGTVLWVNALGADLYSSPALGDVRNQHNHLSQGCSLPGLDHHGITRVGCPWWSRQDSLRSFVRPGAEAPS